ncbi:MAG: alpha/beta hydrolase [Oscillochloris sp.]|nr:alpha/beta hydrolase [Oscillochloris sp.]
MPRNLEQITRRPVGQARPTPLLFIHGAWHAAWCWEKFLPYFAEQGYECHALSLRGHGASDSQKILRWASAADYVADVERIAASLPTPPVIIGHALGGYVAQLYLEQHSPPAAVLLAPVPVTGTLDFMAGYAARYPGPFLKMVFTSNTMALFEDPAIVHAMLFSPNLPAEDLKSYAARLQPESLRVGLESMFLRMPRPRPGTPMLVLAGANDQIFSVDEMSETAHAWQAELDVLPDMAHDMMLDTHWQGAAERVAAWLSGRGL